MWAYFTAATVSLLTESQISDTGKTKKRHRRQGTGSVENSHAAMYQ